ncbi:hypothetical protein ABFS82_14G218000 [Erythranthe guttata]|uniref:Fungal lipase-type domain-containing protein n=1 Tax=Erythranthe guttata TaxID=4155 RepID=A0A022QTY0_ERYGU|nr:PREDICTED: phospholipase A1-Igamma3, chloroplastic-like [Erythranthe guttata]EYU31376.1 hypothetical protein MIMGU_mgv1a004679mg [Erythranthe guttata]|eukprot:XP_012844664.1 PREDICTED: phospholipase A1-Igamma3, chloroplastic-like [Erythranthe guttata]
MASLHSYSFNIPTHKNFRPSIWNNKGTISSNLFFSNKSYQTFIAIKSSSTSTTLPILSQEKIEEKIEEIADNNQESPEENPKQLDEIWMEIQGCNNWENLLEPMNPLLRQEIIRYGEMAQACYDSFDFDPNSKYCGTCKYEGANFFERVGLSGRGYTLTRYLYATSNINLPNFFQKSKISSVWSQHANWMGYVAVATDEAEIRRLGRRDITVAWRGTVTYLEWIHDLKDILHPAHFRADPSIKIESGFFDLYTSKESSCEYCSFSAREQVLAEVRRLIHRYRGEKLSITITGHSLGAALALLSAYDMAEMKLNLTGDHGDDAVSKIPLTVFSFAGPRVGNLKFKERCDYLGIKVLRVVNAHDKVPKMPGIITNEKFPHQRYIEDKLSFPWSYAHVGVELALDHTRSPFLKKTGDLRDAHNLEAHLHLLDGYHGKDGEFRSAGGRDIALVNKSCGFLKSECEVPPNWWQDEHKGMVRTGDGRWVLPERPRVESHPPDTAHHFAQVIKYARAKLELF